MKKNNFLSIVKNLCPWHIRAQFMLLAALFLSVAIIAYSGYTIKRQTDRAEQDIRRQALVLAKSISTSSVQLLLFDDFAALEELVVLFVEFPNILGYSDL